MELINPPNLPAPLGFSYVAVNGPGKLVAIAGQVGQRFDGTYGRDLVEQFGIACENVATALAAVSATPADVTFLQIFTTEIGGYRQSLDPIGRAYRRTFGDHYPPMALIGISELFDREAQVELVATAFVADRG